MEEVKFASIESALEDVKEGKLIIVMDDIGRENEGDLFVAAEKVTPEAINFMATYGKGLICVPLSETYAQKLQLDPMVLHNTDNHETAFTVSVDYKTTTTGISAFERAETIEQLFREEAKAEDFRRPGHIFPLVAKKGGVFVRKGHTEAAVDLARLAGFKEGGVICEIMKADGTMARRDDLLAFAQEKQLKVITIEDLITYRKEHDVWVQEVVATNLPTAYGTFKIHGFINEITGEEHVALVKGDITSREEVLVRIHSECLTGDVFGSERCDCGEQLHAALKQIEAEGCGILLYLRQEGRGIGLVNKLKAYALQEQGLDTVEANVALGFKDDLRDYAVGAKMLHLLGVQKVQLMTNNPRKIKGLETYGTVITKRISLEIPTRENNVFYLRTKREKLGHLFKYI